MTSVSKTVYIDKLDELVNKYSNTYHSTIKMKFADLKSSTYPAGKYWSPGCSEDVPLQRPQDFP